MATCPYLVSFQCVNKMSDLSREITEGEAFIKFQSLNTKMKKVIHIFVSDNTVLT